jgi:ATP-dependent exoDNAse (exonuclease V) alpha subunit
MRTGDRAGEVFDALLERGQIAIYPTDVQRIAALTTQPTGSKVIADTNEQVKTLNAAIRQHRLTAGKTVLTGALTTAAGDCVSLGDLITTRRNDRSLGVANRDCWTVTGVDDNGNIAVRGRGGERRLPASYVHQHVELAYATTVHGAQGETVDDAHLLIGETTGGAAAYVGMTRGRDRNTAHVVAESTDDARKQWIEVFSRECADLGPRHAVRTAADAIERYGPRAVRRSTSIFDGASRSGVPYPHEHVSTTAGRPARGPSR